MTYCSRRKLLRAGLATAALGSTGRSLLHGAPADAATEWVTLGKSGVKVTRLAFGTGSNGGRVQRQLGQQSSPAGALRLRPRDSLL
jgi:hypothetical protein